MNGGGGFEPRENGLCHDSWQCLEIPFGVSTHKAISREKLLFRQGKLNPIECSIISLSLTHKE